MIRIEGLVKRYGTATALDGVSLDVPAGSVFGLVGPNGAGKTTLLSILAGLRRATEGSVAIDAAPEAVAVLPDTPRFDPWLTGREVVALAGHLAGPEVLATAVDDALAGAGLSAVAGRRVGGYSRGMLQRLGIAATVVGDPAVMLLDEPASALDPAGRRDVLDLVARLRGRATVVFSSHILGDVQEVSDHLAILHEGRIRLEGPTDRVFDGRAEPAIRIRLRSGAESLEAALRACPWAAGVERRGDQDLRVAVTSASEAEAGLAPVLAAAGVAVISIRPEAPTLEDLFLEVTA